MYRSRKRLWFRSSLLLIAVSSTRILYAQSVGNNVNNGSFEDTINVVYIRPKYWGALDSGQYFGPFLRSPNQVPKNSFGFQSAKHGANYIGLSSLSTNAIRGYPRNRLKNSLVANHTYCVRFYVALSNQSTHGIDAIGAYFGDNTLDTIKKCNDPITYLAPQIANPPQNIITDTLNWTAITGTFVANGTEKYMVIGNFKSDANTNTTLTNTLNLPANFADYYLDDVSVIDIDLPAYAGPDKAFFQGDSVFIGREPDVGIDEACTWHQLPNMATPIATVAGLYVKPVTTTTYVVRQQLWCSSVKWDTVVVYEDALGNDELGMLNEEIRISPNPAADVVILSLANENLSQYFSQIEITDAQGRVLKQINIEAEEKVMRISTVDLADGIYLIRVIDDIGEKLISRKLALQH